MNKYKIDYSKYAHFNYPYALYGKAPGLFRRWEHIKSFATKEEAKELHAKLAGLPILLD